MLRSIRTPGGMIDSRSESNGCGSLRAEDVYFLLYRMDVWPQNRMAFVRLREERIVSTPLPFIHIKSGKFPILPGEDEEIVNEGTYGKALSQYLQERLEARGYEVPFICCEDWGWWVEIWGNPVTTGVCVYATSLLPETHELCVAVTPDPGKKWSWRRFRNVRTTDIASKLQADLTDIFNDDPEVEVLGFPEPYPLD